MALPNLANCGRFGQSVTKPNFLWISDNWGLASLQTTPMVEILDLWTYAEIWIWNLNYQQSGRLRRCQTSQTVSDLKKTLDQFEFPVNLRQFWSLTTLQTSQSFRLEKLEFLKNIKGNFLIISEESKPTTPASTSTKPTTTTTKSTVKVATTSAKKKTTKRSASKK